MDYFALDISTAEEIGVGLQEFDEGIKILGVSGFDFNTGFEESWRIGVLQGLPKV